MSRVRGTSRVRNMAGISPALIGVPYGVAGLDANGRLVGPIYFQRILTTDTETILAPARIGIVCDSLTAVQITVSKVVVGDGLTQPGVVIFTA